ncbi:hypothetical protein FP804_03670, partial [archaeon]|nr:hypothetical protein [archaeon]
GDVSITRDPGCPDNKTLSILMDSSLTYIIVLDYTAEEKGGNPVWVTINYRNISNKMHLVFNVNKNETQTRMFNLTETLDMMIRGVCLIKFESTSCDPDGDDITIYEWLFDDEYIGADMVVYHYCSVGNHSVGLTVTDENGASGTVYRNITILDAVEYYSGYRGIVGVTLDCPADLLITDKYGNKIGFENGELVNLVPNATVIVCGDIEIYILPRNTDYDYTVAGIGHGEYKFTVFSPGEYEPGEYDPGEYSPGEYDPGEYGPGEYEPGEYDPGEYSGKTYIIESNTSVVTTDGFVIRMDAGTVNITSNTEKYYSMIIVNGTNKFMVEEMSISSGATHSYAVDDWNKLETNATSVKLSIDENNDGMFDRFFNLSTGSAGKDLLKPDLTIIEIICSNENPTEGEQVLFYVTIQNIGWGPAHDIDVSLYVDDVLVDSTSIAVIWTDRTAFATLLWVAKAGNHSFTVRLDADETVNELNENNNEYIGSVYAEGKLGRGFDYTAILISAAVIIAVVCAAIGVGLIKKRKTSVLAPSKRVTVRCPKCGETIDVTGLERPTEVVCPKCGEKETLE